MEQYAPVLSDTCMPERPAVLNAASSPLYQEGSGYSNPRLPQAAVFFRRPAAARMPRPANSIATLAGSGTALTFV